MATPETDHGRQERSSAGEHDERIDVPGTLTTGVQLVLGSALVAHGRNQRSRRGTAMALGGGLLVFRAIDGPAVLKRALADRTETGGQREAGPEPTETDVRRSITVGESPRELYEQWRDPETFSQVMGHFADITESGEDRYRWTVHGPYGQDFSWETHIVAAEPGELLRWETPTDAVLPNDGAVEFREAAGDRGTIVTLSVSFDPPGGALGNTAMEQLDIAPAKLAGRALQRFKSLVETGEVPTLDGNPSGRGSGDLL